MVRPEIKSWSSTDVDVTTYVSENPEADSVSIRLLCGPAGDEGEESFDLLLTTPGALMRELESTEVIVGRHLLIQKSLDLPRAYAQIERAIVSISGKDWSEVANKLARLGHWEFEDYSA